MGDAEVGNVPIVKHVPFRGLLKCFFVLEDTILERLNLLRKVAILDCSVSFVVGDGCKESVRNGAKEFSVNVGVRGKGGLSRPWRHCWQSWGCRMRDWEWN